MTRNPFLLLALGLPLVLGGCPGDSSVTPDAKSATASPPAPKVPEKPKARALGGRWQEAGALPLAIERPVAIELSDGRVFAYGNGDDGRGALWNPKTNTWSATKASKRPRGEPAASLLSDGTVLVTGGVHIPKGHYVLRSAERYDPKTDTWSEAGSMGAQRRGHTHTTLSDGRILVTGGVGGGFAAPTRRIDVFDLGTNKYTEHATLGAGRSFHATLDLGSAGLLVVGGQDKNGPLRTVEICDPGAKRCRSITRPSPRDRAALALLSNGNALITGGLDSRSTSATEVIYDPGKGQFMPTGSMRSRRNGHTLTTLGDGRVLAVGGEKSAVDSAEVYDPSAKAWAKAPSPSHGRHGHAAVALRSGVILLVGGADASGKPVLVTEKLPAPKRK